MKTALVLFTLIFSPNLSHACSCEAGTWPLDPTDAIVSNAIRLSELGRGAKVNVDSEEDLQVIQTYPTLGERMNLASYKGTSCEVFGPNRESHFYCSGVDHADYRVIVRSGEKSCAVVLRVKNTRTKIKVRELENTCRSRGRDS